ncbi:ImmA/IrrE family metallo-endopeptidase [Romboutsia lituseburensis]|uniref:ImmA/IrrE family metallo-endopeptidase n=1 Tax=Romboutsia lituseburensis TaxID=1537 RepID=UPI00215B5843|nr:ImmA/IrrE family metallo-endopeptidase [Romboutsia lituseburensis]MCR8744374.1 ImmA/IrrE family metallo-endopeptidase [Romboutsia lituseburensis]
MSKVKGKVIKLINKYKTSNLYELCDYLNIKIKRDPLGSTKGYFLNVDGNFFITLNSSLDEWEERVVLAHELAHSVLHKKTNICFLKSYTYSVTNKLENEANQFAAHILISDKALNKFSRGYEYVTAEQLSKYFKVPEELIMYKFNNNI